MEGPAYAIEELAKPKAIQIALHITGVKAVEDVVDPETDARMLVLYGETDLAQYLEVGRDESREAQLIPGSNEVVELVNG